MEGSYKSDDDNGFESYEDTIETSESDSEAFTENSNIDTNQRQISILKDVREEVIEAKEIDFVPNSFNKEENNDNVKDDQGIIQDKFIANECKGLDLETPISEFVVTEEICAHDGMKIDDIKENASIHRILKDVREEVIVAKEIEFVPSSFNKEENIIKDIDKEESIIQDKFIGNECQALDLEWPNSEFYITEEISAHDDMKIDYDVTDDNGPSQRFVEPNNEIDIFDQFDQIDESDVDQIMSPEEIRRHSDGLLAPNLSVIEKNVDSFDKDCNNSQIYNYSDNETQRSNSVDDDNDKDWKPNDSSDDDKCNHEDSGEEESDQDNCNQNNSESLNLEINPDREHNNSEKQQEITVENNKDLVEINKDSFSSLNSSAEVNPELKQYSKGGKTARNLDKIIVPKLALKENGKRIRKKLQCPYCELCTTSLGRHVKRAHKDKKAVKKVIKAIKDPKSDHKTKRNYFKRISRQGEFFHNFYLEKECSSKDKIVGQVPRRIRATCADESEQEAISAKERLPCPKCGALFKRKYLPKHCRLFCPFNSKTNASENARQIATFSKVVAPQCLSNASDVMKDRILPVLRTLSKEPEIVPTILNDFLIIEYGNQLCRHYKNDKHYEMIRSRLRYLAKLLLKVREYTDEVTDFTSLIDNSKYNFIVKAIEFFAGINSDGSGYIHASVATNYTSLIKQITVTYICIWNKKISRNLSKEQIDEIKREKKFAQSFYELFTSEVKSDINKTAVETIYENRRNKIVKLPSPSDIQKLKNFLDSESLKAYESLKVNPTKESWIILNKYTMLNLLLFNRRRVGDVQRIRIMNYNTHAVLPPELTANMNEEEKVYAEFYHRFLTLAKQGKSLPILITLQWIKYIDLCLKLRKKFGVPDSNPFVFGLRPRRKTENNHLKACEALREVAQLVEADCPLTLRGTELRKQFATMVLNMELSENRLNQIADFMGHSRDIQKNIYFQNDGRNQVLHIAKALEQAQGSLRLKSNNCSVPETDSEGESESEDENDDVEGESDSEKDEDFSNDTTDDKVSRQNDQKNVSAKRKVFSTSSDTDPSNDECLKKSTKTSAVKVSRKSCQKTKIRKRMTLPEFNDSDTSDDDSVQKPAKKSVSRKNSQNITTGRGSNKTAWSDEAKQLLLKEFPHSNFKRNEYPSLSSLKKLKDKYTHLYENKGVPAMKTFLSNDRKKFYK